MTDDIEIRDRGKHVLFSLPVKDAYTYFVFRFRVGLKSPSDGDHEKNIDGETLGL